MVTLRKIHWNFLEAYEKAIAEREELENKLNFLIKNKNEKKSIIDLTDLNEELPSYRRYKR